MDEIEWSQAALETMQVWQESETFEGLCELNARFIEGKICFIPGWSRVLSCACRDTRRFAATVRWKT